MMIFWRKERLEQFDNRLNWARQFHSSYLPAFSKRAAANSSPTTPWPMNLIFDLGTYAKPGSIESWKFFLDSAEIVPL